MFISTDAFVNLLPGFMQGRVRYRVLLATYNDVGDQPVGFLPPGSGGLEITTRCGNLAYSIEPPNRSCDSVPTQMEHQAGQAQGAVEKTTSDAEWYDLAVVYLGLTGFDKALTYAMGLKRRRQVGTVVVLTCDCDTATKMTKLAGPLRENRISAALFTAGCGGQGDFQLLIEHIPRKWMQVRAV